MTSLSGSETNRNRATRKEEGIEYWFGGSAPKTPGIYRLQPECLDKHNRTDHLLTKPDILTCYGQSKRKRVWGGPSTESEGDRLVLLGG